MNPRAYYDNVHAAMEVDEFDYSHGTSSRYLFRGCRCAACLDAMAVEKCGACYLGAHRSCCGCSCPCHGVSAVGARVELPPPAPRAPTGDTTTRGDDDR